MGLGKSISKARTLGEIGSILYVISLVIPNAILLIWWCGTASAVGSGHR